MIDFYLNNKQLYFLLLWFTKLPTEAKEMVLRRIDEDNTDFSLVLCKMHLDHMSNKDTLSDVEERIKKFQALTVEQRQKLVELQALTVDFDTAYMLLVNDLSCFA